MGPPFIVTERLPGPTLADEIARGPLSERRVVSVLDNVLAALSTAHASGVLHRDVKPGNILAAACGDGVKVADFGIAKTPAAVHTITGQIVGTLAYLSPERVAGAPASAADDIYAVGVVGYEALAGHRPFRKEDNIAALAHEILTDHPPPLKAERPDVDPELIAVIEKAMARDPSRRFSSAEGMRVALNGGQPNRSVVPSSGPTRPPTRVLPAPPLPPPGTFVSPGTYIAPMERRRLPRTTRAKRAVGAAAILALLVVAASVLLLSTSTSSEPAPVSTSTSVPPPPNSPAIPPPTPQPSLVEQPVTQVDQSTIEGNSGKPENKGGNGKKNFKPGRGH